MNVLLLGLSRFARKRVLPAKLGPASKALPAGQAYQFDPLGYRHPIVAPFEGIVTVKYEDPAKPVTTLTYEMKGTKFRVNLPEATNQGKKGFVLFDTEGKKTQLVLDDRKVFVSIDLGSANVANATPPAIKV